MVNSSNRRTRRRAQNDSQPARDLLERRGLILRVVGTVLISVIIPVATGLANGRNGVPLLSSFQQFEVGAFLFITISLTSIGYELGKLVRIKEGQRAVWMVQDDIDEWLLKIRASFEALIQSGPPHKQNLFTQYFERILTSVSDDIHHAASKKELPVNELTFGATDILIKLISEGGPHKLRLLHGLDTRPNNFDCSTWARSYYADITRLAHDKQVQVHRLFLFSEAADIEDPLAQYLFAFHAANPGYDYRVLRRSDWLYLAKGFGLSDIQDEIGVWGDKLAYSAYRSSREEMHGAYTSSTRQIKRFQELFDAAWKLASRPPLPSTTASTMTVDKLFNEAMALSNAAT